MILSETYKDIAHGLDAEIFRALIGAATEQRYPCHSADEGDDLIKDNLTRAKRLRAIREEFEEAMTGVIIARRTASPSIESTEM